MCIYLVVLCVNEYSLSSILQICLFLYEICVTCVCLICYVIYVLIKACYTGFL